MNILFICKWNRFRSRLAEAYFNKINKNKNIIADSAGLFQGRYPLDSLQVKIGKEFNLDIDGKPKAVSAELLYKTDVIIIVADDVPKEPFQIDKKEVITFGIKDEVNGNEENIRKIVRLITDKVDSLILKLEEKKW